MSIVEEILNLWEAKSGNLQQILQKIIELRKKCFSLNEKIPIDLDLQIIIQSNYSNGFGNELNEIIDIVNLFQRCSDEDFISPQVSRLAAILCSSILSQFAVDEQQNTRGANTVLHVFGVHPNSSKSEIIKTLLPRIMFILDQKIEIWFLEFISYFIILVGLLKVMNSWGDEELVYLDQTKTRFKMQLNQKEIEYIEQWKDNWLDKNDYFRLNTLLITNKFAPEELWINIAKSLLS